MFVTFKLMWMWYEGSSYSELTYKLLSIPKKMTVPVGY